MHHNNHDYDHDLADDNMDVVVSLKLGGTTHDCPEAELMPVSTETNTMKISEYLISLELI